MKMYKKPLATLNMVVDAQSEDMTAEIAISHRASVITQTGNGKGRAVVDAFSILPNNTAYVMITDADYTYHARYVPQMLEIIERDPAIGMVTGYTYDFARIDLLF